MPVDHRVRPATMRPGLTITDAIRSAAAARPERTAITIGDELVSYARLVERIDRVASGAMLDLRLQPGDRAAIVLPNCLPYMELVAGLSSVGAPCAMLPPMATPAEIRFVIEDCTPRVVVCHANNEEAVRAAVHGLVERVLVVGRQGIDSYDDWLAKASPATSFAQVRETDIFSISYSSGATGKPKGILLSHRSRILSAYVAAAEYRAFGPDTRMLVSTPIFHGAGFLNLLAPLCFGGQAFILPRFGIDELFGLITRHRITKAHMVPAHFAAYFGLSAADRARFDTSSLACVVSGTAPLAQAMKHRIVEAFGAHVLHERYGSTEASLVTNLRPEDQLRKEACVGNPFASVEVEIRAADGTVLPDGETGELWSRSPLMFSGYWNRPEVQAGAVRDGWVSAGDMAKRDDEGYIYLVDRKNDMIITGGENVYPREIEEVLLHHPAVAEAAVIGMPHDYWGEAVTAVVHLRPGAAVTEEALRQHCAVTLARWKVPKQVVIGNALPRNGMGKILRREVKAWALEHLPRLKG